MSLQLISTTARGYVLYLQQHKKSSRYPGNRKNVSPKTLQCYVRTLKALSSWLFQEELTPDNRLKNLKIPKAPHKIIDPLTIEEIENIFNSLKKNNPAGLRDKALLSLMQDAGVRTSGVCSLLLGHLNLDKYNLKVFEKGMKVRIIPFGDFTRLALYHYLNNGISTHCLLIITHSIFLPRFNLYLTY